MKTAFYASLLCLALGACRQKPDDTPQPEYADWYALKSPDARAIEAVSGDIDGTLVITTRYAIYQTKDQGKNWTKGNYKLNLGITGFAQSRDTLLAFTGELQSGSSLRDPTYAVSPTVYSLDQGVTWQLYRDWRRNYTELRVARNRTTTVLGNEYRIAVLLTPITPQSAGSYVETVGIETPAGRQISLPEKHQITSLYSDKESRLYVTASGALCGTKADFAFCGTQSGVLYVSKRPQP